MTSDEKPSGTKAFSDVSPELAGPMVVVGTSVLVVSDSLVVGALEQAVTETSSPTATTMVRGLNTHISVS